jgi:thioredoxin 1
MVSMKISRRLAVVFLAAQALSLAAAGDPYPPPASAAADLRRAQEQAKASGRILMTILGGNWCPDCRALHANLERSPVREYVEKHFVVVGINVGELDANLDIAKDLGVNLKKGVPAAGFFGPDLKPIGYANNGELSTARHYDANQILTFLRKLAEERVVERPK